MNAAVGRRVLAGLAVGFMVLPAVLALVAAPFAPPRASVAVAVISLLAGALVLAILYYLRFWLTRSVNSPALRIGVLAVLAILSATVYFLLVDRVNVYAKAPDGTPYGYVFVPLSLGGDLAKKVEELGSVERVIEKFGPRSFERALDQMPGSRASRTWTTLALLATFVAAQITLVAAVTIAVMQPQHVGETGLGKHFRVALSFPGDYRPFVKEVAEKLRSSLGQDKVFYDLWYEAELAGVDLDQRLRVVYRDESDLLVVFLGRRYDKKLWTRLEWRAIFDAIVLRQRDRRDVMFVRMDSARLIIIASTDGYADARTKSPEQVAELVITRLKLKGP